MRTHPNATDYYLSVFDPATNQWDSRLLPGYFVTREDYNSLASLGDRIFLLSDIPPPPPGVAEPQGDVVRYDLSTGETRRFGPVSSDSVSIGWDGKVYVAETIRNDAANIHSTLHVFDPDTLAEKRQVVLTFPVGNVTVSPDGTIFASGLDNRVLKLASDGTIAATFAAQTNGTGIRNLQRDRNGRLTLLTDRINITDEAFAAPTVISPGATEFGFASVTSAAPGQ